MRIVLCMTGASGAVYGLRMLEELRTAGCDTHLIVSEWAEKTIAAECGVSLESVAARASRVWGYRDMGAPVSSGSYPVDAVVVCPCSMKTLAGIAHGYADNLIIRAGDVALKERRRLVLVPRESPLSVIHIENMLAVARAGAIVAPPCPSFYGRPASLDDIVNQTVGRVLDLLGIRNDLAPRWGETAGPAAGAGRSS
ncbi:MAG: UbiX family flavin prenyltransferase [Firmicutes bacterium]|nr:UbiX family flavin prenyltransferase [Bacillota bacterium]